MDWYPWNPTDHREDTMHLTAEQDGMYRRLIDHYMESRSPLPDNDQAWARVAGVDLECFKHAKSILQAFFKLSKTGKWQHKRCDMELEAQDKRSLRMTERARKAAEKRWGKQQDECYEHATGMLADATRTKTKTSKIEDILPETPEKNGQLRAADTSPDFEVLWKMWPKERRCEKPKAYDAWKEAVKKASPQTILTGAMAYVVGKEALDGFAPYPAKWLKNERWQEEHAAAIPFNQKPENRMPSPAGG